MTRILFYTCLLLLLSTALTSFGWYLSCNKPCDPEIIITEGDTVYLDFKADTIYPSNPFKNKVDLIDKVFAKKGEHIVRPGENLYRIGLKYGLTAEELRIANNLKDYDIKAWKPLKIPKPTEKDTVYTYHKEFGDSTVKGSIWTQSYGPILSQSVNWETSLIKPKTRLFGGVSLHGDRLNGIGAVELKSGFMITGQFGQSGYQIGILKRLK